MVLTKKNTIRLLNLFFIILFIISLFAVATSKSFAKPNPYQIRSVKIVDIQGKAEGSILGIDKNEIKNDFKFHELGDSITLNIQLKNTDLQDYIIKSLVSNLDDNIEYTIKYDEDLYVKAGTTFDVELTLIYKNEMSSIEDRESNTPINFIVICSDDIPSEGNDVQPTKEVNTTTTTSTTTTTTVPVVNEDNNEVVDDYQGINNNASIAHGSVIGAEVLHDSFSTSPIVKNNRNLFIILLLISTVGSAVCCIIITRHNKKQLLCVVCIIFVVSMIIPTVVNAKDMSFYGIVLNKPSIYNKLKVKVNGNEQIVNYDEVLNIDEPHKDGYTFTGWLNGNDYIDITQGVTEDLDLTPSFEPNIYHVVFNKNNSNAYGTMIDQDVAYDSTINLNDNEFVATGYRFDGWNTKADGTGINYDNNQEILNIVTDGTVTLYAKWHKITTSTLKNGSTLNQYMKKIAGNSNTATNAVDKNIKALRYVDYIPNEYKNSNYVISDNSSKDKTYMWYEDGIVYYSSEADIIYLNKNSSYMFNVLSSLESVDVRFDTSNVTDMSQMFWKDEKLSDIDLTKFNTSKVKSMRSMFSEAYSMSNFDFRSFDTSNVTNFAFMFNQCYALVNLDLTDFDTSSATDMNHMFSSTTGLKSLNVSSFNTSKVTNMQSMFHDMYSIEELDISNFDTSNVTNMTKMFNTAKSLKKIYVSELFTTNKVNGKPQMFNDDVYLTGGNGTIYNKNNNTSVYAHIDEENNPGYFTRK